MALSKWESRWALIRTIAAIVSVLLQGTGIWILLHR
jgi:hypothetical protein